VEPPIFKKTEAMGELTGRIANDFDNLLTVIASRSEWIRDRLARGFIAYRASLRWLCRSGAATPYPIEDSTRVHSRALGVASTTHRNESTMSVAIVFLKLVKTAIRGWYSVTPVRFLSSLDSGGDRWATPRLVGSIEATQVRVIVSTLI